MLKLNAFFEIVKLFLNIRLGGRECKYADQITLFVSPNVNVKAIRIFYDCKESKFPSPEFRL